MTWYEKYAASIDVAVNSDRDTVVCVLEGLEHNKETYGARYCPCRLDRNKDTICPCKEMRDTNHCHCQLFV